MQKMARSLGLRLNGIGRAADDGTARLKMGRLRASRRAPLLAAGVLACVVAAGCGGSDKSGSSSTADSQAGSGSASNASPAGDSGTSKGGKLHFYLVYHAPASDAFAQHLVTGAKDAAEDLGVSVTFRGPNNETFQAADQARLISDAIAARPNGIILSDPAPKGMDPMIKRAISNGIPVVMTNCCESAAAGIPGLLGYVGGSEREAGKAAAQRMCAAGAKDLLWLTIPPGLVSSLDDRGAGIKEGFTCGKVKFVISQIAAFTGNSASVAHGLEAALHKDPNVDAVVGAGNLAIPPILTARATLGARADKVHWSSFDLSPQGLQAVIKHQMDFLVDGQPYLQGYLPVLHLAQRARYGITPQKVTTTGPNLVDATTAATVLPLLAKHVR